MTDSDQYIRNTRIKLRYFFRGTRPICLYTKFRVRWCYGFGGTALHLDINFVLLYIIISHKLCRNTLILYTFGKFVHFYMLKTLMLLEMEIIRK